MKVSVYLKRIILTSSFIRNYIVFRPWSPFIMVDVLCGLNGLIQIGSVQNCEADQMQYGRKKASIAGNKVIKRSNDRI